MKKFTFKQNKATGRYRSFFPENTTIKHNGKEVGTIFEDGFRIQLQVIKKDILEDGNPNCVWKNVLLKYRPTSLQDAKDYLNNNQEKILSLVDLWYGEE